MSQPHSASAFTLLEPALPLAFEPCPSACRMSVIIPARNEEAILCRTLDALRDQRDLDNHPLPHSSYEVLLLLNNCTDSSVAVAERYQQDHPELQLHLVTRELAGEHAFVGTARRLLMDAAYMRQRGRQGAAILSTDGDTVVAPDWIARNQAELQAGAEVVGGVIHLFPQDLALLEREHPGLYRAYRADRAYQRLVARLESLLDPDPADPWPRHLEHFGASLACTPEVYARAGGLPPLRHLEDVAFIDELRKVGARIRHSSDVHIFTSARFDGRAEVGLSWQLRHWRHETENRLPQQVDSAEWLEHRFRTLNDLRLLNAQRASSKASLPGAAAGRTKRRRYPVEWLARLAEAVEQRLPTPRFLEVLDCDRLIDEMFQPLGVEREDAVESACQKLAAMIAAIENAQAGARRPAVARSKALPVGRSGVAEKMAQPIGQTVS